MAESVSAEIPPVDRRGHDPASVAARKSYAARWIVGAMVGIVLGITFGYAVATKTAVGRGWLLETLNTRTATLFGSRGRLRIGVIREIGPRALVADDVAIVDTAGIPVISARHVEGTLEFSALWSKAIRIRTLALTGVRLDLRKDFTGPFNIAYILSGDTTRHRADTLPGFGDDVTIAALDVRDATVDVVAPWSPNAIFTGTARDSVIAAYDRLHDLQRTDRGLLVRRHIVLSHVAAHDAVIRDPKRGAASLNVDTLQGTISDPPVTIAQAAGRLSWTSDSLILDLPAIRLPQSSGSAVGTVSWYTRGPVRYDVRVRAKAGLRDLQWIWDALPLSGGGSADVHLRTLADANDAEYAIQHLDVSAMESHVTGDITVTSRPASLELSAVDLRFAPMSSALLRRLSYDAVPATVRGTLTGRLVARVGGPLRALRVDDLDARFVDANVPGAVSTLRARGLVSIGAAPSGSNALVMGARIDLRSVRALDSALPAIDGIVSGGGTIAYADLARADVRNVDLTWTDAAGHVSRVRGDARVAYASRDPELALSMTLDPLSMRALARLDSTIPIRSDIAGTVSATGRLSELQWRAALTANGASGIELTGTAGVTDASWRATARGAIQRFDARAWFGSDGIVATALTGDVAIEGSGERGAAASAASGQTASFTLDAARLDARLRQEAAPDYPAFDLIASGVLDSTRMRLDSAIVQSGGVIVDARGALARDSAGVDTLVVSARADTLENVRPELLRVASMLAPLDSGRAASLRGFATDTLRGDASLSGYVFGSLADVDATLALGVRGLQVGPIRAARIFGSFNATDVLRRPFFEAAATLDDVRGVGAVRLTTTEFRLSQASPDSARVVLDVSSVDTTSLVVRGGYARDPSTFRVSLDSLRFTSRGAVWRNVLPIRIASDSAGFRIDSVDVRSSRRGALALRADVPTTGPISGRLTLDGFPIGSAAAFTLGIKPFAGTLTGAADFAGTRPSPLLSWRVRGDSLGVNGTYLPRITSEGNYSDRRLEANALLADTSGGGVRVDARVPIDLAIASVEKRLLSDAVDATVTADSLRLETLGFAVEGVARPRGTLNGQLTLAGTFDRPTAAGELTLSHASALFTTLGIEPRDGRLVLQAARDSLLLRELRFTSGGPANAITASGVLRFPEGKPATLDVTASANEFVAANSSDGTNVVVSGEASATGPARRPTVSGSLFVPRAIIVTDPLGATAALDPRSPAYGPLLTPEERQRLDGVTESYFNIADLANVTGLRVSLGDQVFVRTPEANVRLTGALDVAVSNGQFALDGEVAANRGQYRLDLGVVRRTFNIDSGRVRFYGNAAIEPTLDITATNLVRVPGDEVAVQVRIGGTLTQPVLRLSSSSPLYGAAPESELISLLIFGAPTFALDGDKQSTVRAVTGFLSPTLGGAAESLLQRLVPTLNTVQVSTAGRSDALSEQALFDNLTISAGKQLGDRTFLRVNTGVCRGNSQTTARSTSVWYGLAAEYRFRPGLSAQIGADPGASPCTQLTSDRRWQFGFDLFREWVF